MGFKDPRDPRDPWAFRSTWTGEVRTGYDELWIVIPLISLLVILAFLLILPLMIYKTCPTILNKRFLNRFEVFLQVLHETGRKRKPESNNEMCFNNPAYMLPTVQTDPQPCRQQGGDSRRKQKRSSSCPSHGYPQAVPKIKL